jgi:DNA repair ATPase RecN
VAFSSFFQETDRLARWCVSLRYCTWRMVSQQLRFDGNCARAGYDKIESAWTNGSDRKLDKVQETVVELSVRSERLPGRGHLDRMLRKSQEETDKKVDKIQQKVDQLDTKVEEKVTELKDQMENLEQSMEKHMGSILQALRQMRPEPEPEA